MNPLTFAIAYIYCSMGFAVAKYASKHIGDLDIRYSLCVIMVWPLILVLIFLDWLFW